MIHTGSRGLGHQVCTDALSACDQWVLMQCSCLQGLGARTDWLEVYSVLVAAQGVRQS